MKVFLSVLILIFSVQSFAKADEAGEFEIEGMSIGESLLDYFSADEIKTKISSDMSFYYPNKTFVAIGTKVKSDGFPVVKTDSLDMETYTRKIATKESGQ